MAIRIRCIKKSGGYHEDPHHAIESVGWTNEETGERNTSTRLQVYDWITKQNGKAYVTDRLGNRAYVGTREDAYCTKFLETYADQVWTDNLLSLPECP